MGFGEAFDYLHEGEIFREYAQLTTLDNENGERDFSLIGLSRLDDQGYSVLKPQQWPVIDLQDKVVNQRFLLMVTSTHKMVVLASFLSIIGHHKVPLTMTIHCYSTAAVHETTGIP
ncbi:assimilatory nitrate reductase large subunit [Vibrio astriarenae]|nr:assimilatory nitrate reductase large subunit [Vibrio sp. C7]